MFVANPVRTFEIWEMFAGGKRLALTCVSRPLPASTAFGDVWMYDRVLKISVCFLVL